jgi:peroxiredoxin Q/BCP
MSADTVKSHKKFKRKYDLPYPLLADPDKDVLRAFGVWGEKKLFGKAYEGIHRTTYVIDPEGRVRKVFENVSPGGHGTEVLDYLRHELSSN